jgi:hypothetical protein
MTKFSIELERSTGIYYAGEVVRGTIKMNCPSSVTCRSVVVQLKGQARVWWHTGAGDHRRDYDGHTLYQDQRFTIQGNFYKTGLFNEAGENAFFDKIHNLGVMQIPCSATETQRLQLIVRVMDYDWGKKDDLLGEILLDVPALANSGEKQSFPLTHKGQPGKGEVTISAKYLPYDALFPTTTASGILISRDMQKEYCLVLHVHQATGLRKADWVGKNDVYIQAYRPEDAKYSEITPGQKLPGPQKKMGLPANTEIIAPFAFSLRQDAPPSAELRIEDRCHIRYKIRAYLDLANWKDPFATTTITVIPNRPIPKPLLIQPHIENVGPQPLYSSCCSFSSNGVVTIKLVTDRIAYAAGEAIDLSQSTILYEGKNELSGEVVLTGYYRLSTYISSTIGKREYHLGSVPLIPHTETRLSNSNVAFRIPPVYPSFHGGDFKEKEWSHYPCLQWTYTIGIKVGGQGCATSAQAALPCLISSAPPYKEKLQEYKDLAPKKVSFGVWEIFDHAVLGREQGCTTAPSITGPEDGGTTVNVGSPIYTWEGQEDSNYVGGGGHESMNYQPIVTTFDGPMSAQQEQGEIPMVWTDPLPSSGATATATSGIDTLLETMDTELDKRLAVGQWVRKHPVRAQLLSPNDFHSVLTKVTFSLDQASVVGELVAAFEGSNNLTCQHIVLTMTACPYQKTEVAILMAPYATDPHNKESVLQALDYSFDKNSVSGKFES